MSRRLVAVLFLDLVGWTGLAERVDPEPLQLLMEQYYDLCSTTVEEYGGEIEKFIGDAVMAVFGAVRSEEDDAARAVRAARRIRESLGTLHEAEGAVAPLEVHCGLAAGEALVARSPRTGLRIVGDVVNVAARLQAASAAGDVLVDETVADLAAPHFAMTPVAPLVLKGKAALVPAWRVLGPAEAGRPADDPPLVDRTEERALLRDAFDRVTRDRRSRVVVVQGPLGIGKTRLVREIVGELGAGGEPPAVAYGDCPTYGEHENHVALVQMLENLADQAPAAGELLRTDEHVAAVVAGLSDRDAVDHAPGIDEVAWAARHLLARAAAEPFVIVWDNLERAGQSLLGLIGDLTVSLEDLPVLTVCLARPEFAERDTPWLERIADRDVIELAPLGPEHSVELAASLAGSGEALEVQPHALDVVDRATVYGAGNPLFIRLVLAAAAGGRPAARVPATITAVVGAMIDRLPAAAQHLLGAAAVVGPSFSVAELALVDEPDPDAGLRHLLDRQVVRTGDRAGEYHFVQRPVHEVAYARLDKERRLAWHRSLAEHGVSPEFHFEAAVRLLRDVRPHDPQGPGLAGRAAEALLVEGTASLRQHDVPAAIDLLDRAHALVRDTPGPNRTRAAIRLSDALLTFGDTQRAMDVVTAIALDPGDADRWPCVVQRQLLAVRTGAVPEVAAEELLAELSSGPADPFAWCRYEQFRMLVHVAEGRFVAAERAAHAALAHARKFEDGFEEDRLLVALCEIRQWSPTPVEKTLSGCRQLEERFALDRFLLVPVLAAKARCLALLGDGAAARTALDRANAAVDELRLTLGRALVDQAAGLVDGLAGRHAEARENYLRGAEAVDRAGHVPAALTMRVMAAREQAHVDPDAAATEIARLYGQLEAMEVHGRLLCVSVAARLAARTGAATAAIAAVQTMYADTDDPCLRGDVCFDLARANRSAGDHAAAAVMADAAIASYATIGATRPVQRVRAWI